MSLPLLHFVVACSKRHCAREAAHFLLLLFLCPHTTEQGPGNTNPGGSQGSLLEEPFTAARFTNRNIMILQNDRVITIYIQNYKTSKYAGSDTVSIQVSWNKDIKRTEISQCYECLFTDSIFHPLLSNLKKSTSLRERAQMKQSWKKSLTPEKKNRIRWQFTKWPLSFCR